MKRLIVLLIACLVVSAEAASYVKMEQITVATTPIGLSLNLIVSGGQALATVASCRLETAEIRYTIDNTAPTTTVGTTLEPLETLILTDATAMQTFQAIRTGSTSGKLTCTYSKP